MDDGRIGTQSATEFKAAPKRRITVVLDNLRSMANVGALFRISDAFLLEQIYLCGITACPPHREIQKTALGATETVAWKYEAQTADALTALVTQGLSSFSHRTNRRKYGFGELYPAG